MKEEKDKKEKKSKKKDVVSKKSVKSIKNKSSDSSSSKSKKAPKEKDTSTSKKNRKLKSLVDGALREEESFKTIDRKNIDSKSGYKNILNIFTSIKERLKDYLNKTVDGYSSISCTDHSPDSSVSLYLDIVERGVNCKERLNGLLDLDSNEISDFDKVDVLCFQAKIHVTKDDAYCLIEVRMYGDSISEEFKDNSERFKEITISTGETASSKDGLNIKSLHAQSRLFFGELKDLCCNLNKPIPDVCKCCNRHVFDDESCKTDIIYD